MSRLHIHAVVKQYDKEQKSYDVIFTHDYTTCEELTHRFYINDNLSDFKFHSNSIDEHLENCAACIAWHLKKEIEKNGGKLQLPHEIWHTS